MSEIFPNILKFFGGIILIIWIYWTAFASMKLQNQKNYSDISYIKSLIKNHLSQTTNRPESELTECEVEDFINNAVKHEIFNIEHPDSYLSFNSLFYNYIGKRIKVESEYFKKNFRLNNNNEHVFFECQNYMDIRIKADQENKVKSVCVECSKIYDYSDFQMLYKKTLNILNAVIIIEDEA